MKKFIKMKSVIILIGNIGTGKTTLAQKYVNKGYIIIARDGLRYIIGNGNYIFNRKYEPAIWSTELLMFKEFLQLSCNIIIDEVGLNKSMRQRYLTILKYYYPKYKVIAIELPKLKMEEAINRRMKNPHQQNDRKLWIKIWKKFDKIYQSPTKKEGFDKIIRLKK